MLRSTRRLLALDSSPGRTPITSLLSESPENSTSSRDLNQEQSQPKPIAPLHVYRSLLRALTYIPDSWARTILQKQIRTEFEKVRKISKAKDLSRQRLQKGLREARRINRAGFGNRQDLERVLLEAYGRLGRRRRELVQDLLEPDDNESPTTDPQQNSVTEDSKDLRALGFPTKKLHAFIKSQKQRPPWESTYDRPKIRALMPVIPKENIWGRKMPAARQINMIKQWRAETLSKICPPVPQSEWNRLRDLSTGGIPVPKPIPRRAFRESTEEPEETHEILLEQLKNSRVEGNVAFAPTQGLYIKREKTENPWLRREKGGSENVHPAFAPLIYKRSMQRLYKGIWNMTPVMSKDEETKEWIIKWGETKSDFHSGKIPQASDGDPFFEGLPEPQIPRRKVSEEETCSHPRSAKVRRHKDSQWEKVQNTEIRKAKKAETEWLKGLRGASERGESKREQEAT